MRRQILQMKHIWKKYRVGNVEQTVLKDIDFEISEGEFVSILGPSGSGKTTLMNIIGCLDVASGGEYVLSGRSVSLLNEEELAHVRNKQIGFIFQSFHLLPRMNVIENVEPVSYTHLEVYKRQGQKWMQFCFH